MKTFADVKRRLKPGVVLECVENTYQPHLNGQRRRVERVQANAVAFQRAGLDGSFQIEPQIPRREWFWLYYPPSAKFVSIVDANTFRVALGNVGNGHTVMLRFVVEPSDV